MHRTDDPVRDWDAYCLEQERLRDSLPRCSDCGQPIEDDMCWRFYDEPMCDKCAERYRVPTTDLMEW